MDHMVVLFLTSWGTSRLFPIVVVPVYITLNIPLSSASLPTLLFTGFLIIDILAGIRRHLTAILIYISLLISYVEYFSMYLLINCMSFFVKCLFKIFACFLMGYMYICHLVVWVLCIFGYQSLIGREACKYFLPFHRLPFHFANSFLWCAEAFYFDVVKTKSLADFCFEFWWQIQKLFPTPISRSLTLCFLLELLQLQDL